MRQTTKEIEINVAYRWFFGLEMMDKVPHFSTFGKNYIRRFKDTDLFEQIFSHILQECYKFKLLDPSEIIRHTVGMKELYDLRKETIVGIFGMAKANHGFRYTQMIGKARMEMKVGLTFACMNLKKLANMKVRKGLIGVAYILDKFIYSFCT